MDNLKKPLKNLGFSEKEVEIYTALLELRQASYTELARVTGIKRTSLYTMVQALQDRGVVQYSVDTRKLLPAAPDQLFAQLQASTTQFHRFIPQLKELGRKERPISRVQFFSGVEGVKRAYLENEDKKIAKKDRVIRVISDGATWDAFWKDADRTFTREYLQEAKRRGYRWQVLTTGPDKGPYTPETARDFNVVIKMLPEGYKNEFDMEIRGEHIIMADLKSEQPYAIKIISSELARSLQNFFDFSWNLYKTES